MTPPQFAELIGGLISCTGHKMAARDIEIWRRHLSDLADDALVAAFERACAECKAFPSVALIREYAASANSGDTSTVPDVWPAVLKCVRSFGVYQRDEAREAIPPLVWRALGGDVGWEWLCDMTAEQRLTAAAQFRGRYQELREQERKRRALPEHLRPRINNDVEPRERVTAPETRKLIEHTANGMKTA